MLAFILCVLPVLVDSVCLEWVSVSDGKDQCQSGTAIVDCTCTKSCCSAELGDDEVGITTIDDPTVETPVDDDAVDVITPESNYTNTSCSGDSVVSLTLMADETGDGWSGNIMSIYQDGALATFTLESGASVTFCDIDVQDAECVYVVVGGGSSTELSWEIDVSSNSSDYVGASGGVGTTWLEGDETSCSSTASPVTQAAMDCTSGMLADEIAAITVQCGGASCGQCSDNRVCMICIQPNDHPDNPPECGGGLTANHYCADAADAGDTGAAQTVTTVSFPADTAVDDAFIAGIEAAYLDQLPEGTTVTVTVTKTTTGTMTLNTDGTVTEADLVASLSLTLCPTDGSDCTVSVEFVARRRLQGGSTTFTFTIDSDPNAEGQPADALADLATFEAALIQAVADETGATVSGVAVSNVDEVITATVTVDGAVTVDEGALETAIESNTGVDVTGVSTEIQNPSTTDAPATAPDDQEDQGIDFGSAGRVASSLATVVMATVLALAF